MGTTKFQPTKLEVFRGDTETYTFNVKDSAGVAYNLSGYTIIATGRKSEDDTAVLFSITVTDGVIGSNFASGIVVLRIPAATTAVLPDLLVYDLQATSGAIVTTLAKGEIEVTKDVSHA